MKPFSIVAAAIFLLIAVAHLYRLAVGFPIMIGETSVGQAVSWAGLIVASVMAVGLFREARMGNSHHLTLIAKFDPADPRKIIVRRKGFIVRPKTHLPKDSGAHHFHFKLDDQTDKHVKFASLTSADDCSTCPPDPIKPPSAQIDQVMIHNTPGQISAQFRDKNDNKPPQPQPMDVSYQWEFTCDPGATVEPFDPIISNGGKS